MNLIERFRPPAFVIGLFCVLALVICAISVGDGVTKAWAEALNRADRIVVLKGERRLNLMRDGDILKSYWIALGSSPVGHKNERGDGRTPEGVYLIEGRTTDSLYYRAMKISYPNEADRERARQLGVDPGGNILIHAVPEGFEPTEAGARMIDWTNGCIAVTNADMDEIWAHAPDGIPVEIRP